MYIRWQHRKRKHPKTGQRSTVSSDLIPLAPRAPRIGQAFDPLTGFAIRDRFSRVEHYKHDGEDDDAYRQDVAWSAIIVENVRVDGKPKQRHIAYLTTFAESLVG